MAIIITVTMNMTTAITAVTTSMILVEFNRTTSPLSLVLSLLLSPLFELIVVGFFDLKRKIFFIFLSVAVVVHGFLQSDFLTRCGKETLTHVSTGFLQVSTTLQYSYSSTATATVH